MSFLSPFSWYCERYAAPGYFSPATLWPTPSTRFKGQSPRHSIPRRKPTFWPCSIRLIRAIPYSGPLLRKRNYFRKEVAEPTGQGMRGESKQSGWTHGGRGLLTGPGTVACSICSRKRSGTDLGYNLMLNCAIPGPAPSRPCGLRPGRRTAGQGLGGYYLLTETDARRPACQVVSHWTASQAAWRRSGPRGDGSRRTSGSSREVQGTPARSLLPLGPGRPPAGR